MAAERRMKGPTLYTNSRDITRSPEEIAAEKRMKGPTCCRRRNCYHATTWTEFFSDPWVRLQIFASLAYIAVFLSIIEPCLENLGPILFVLFVQVPMIVMLFQLG